MADDRRRPESEPRTLVSHPELRSQQSFPFFSTVGGAPKSWLERTLSLFADVRAGEGVNVLLLTVNVFLLLAGYSLLKPAREALIITEGGARVASYAAAAQALLLLGVVPFYGWVASRVPRVRLIGLTAVFFAANLVLFNLAGQTGLRVGVAFFIWLGIYSVFIVSQFWAFANDVYTEGQGRRLFPIVGVGASLGAWVGAATVEPLVEQVAFTPYTLMLGGAVTLLVAFSITWVVNRRMSRRGASEETRISEAPLSKQGGFQLVLRDRYLAWIGLLIVLLNVVNTTGEFVLRTFVQDAAMAAAPGGDLAGQQEFVSVFYGSV
jgi:AAA family ATP:ADP antiporter